MLNPQAPPFDYGGCSRQPVHGLQMGLSCSYPFLGTYASTPPLPLVPYSSHSVLHHYHYHYLPHYLTPFNISCYTCFPSLLLSPLPDLPSFNFLGPRKLKVEEIDEGDGLVPVMADSESKRSAFHLSKGQSLPCFAGRRRRGVGKRSAACCVPQVDGGVVVSNGHPISKRSSKLKHGGRIRTRRGNAAAAIAWVPKPKSKPFDVKEFEDDDEDRTTLMIKNIPNRFNRENLISILDDLSNQEEDSEENVTYAYDFLYLPIDFQNRCNLGYAFVNFTTTGAALRLYKLLHKLKWETCSKKVCEITYARHQGKESLVDHFKGSIFPCDSDDYLPVVFSPPRDGSASCPEPKTIGKRKY